jgi:cyclic beta-1,2-glucan synthetase
MAAIADLLRRRKTPDEPPWDNSEPIRAELFNIERLEQHAESLASAQEVTSPKIRVRRKPIAHRLEENATALLSAYQAICKSVSDGRPITPAAEWLIDNFHVVEDQIRQIQQDLPPGYYKQLPKLASGPLQGYPRVLGIAWAFVAHTDSLFDPEALRRFVRAYQRVDPLSIGELWAIAITLRIVLIENLRRLADRIVKARAAREAADLMADELLTLEKQDLRAAHEYLRKREGEPISKTFAVQLDQRLRDQGIAAAIALQWLEGQLAAQGSSPDQAVSEEHQRQTAGNATVRNIFTSMRLISDVDWTDWFESVSLVNELLARYPTYLGMDFPTRNQYRNAIEELAKGAEMAELKVAQLVVDITAAHPQPIEPGYFLIGEGRSEIETRINFRPRPIERVRRSLRHSGLLGYAGAISVLSILLLAITLARVFDDAPIGMIIGFAALGLIPISEVAIAAINFVVTKVMGARQLPALELRNGIPENLRTMVVVPTLLTSREAVEEEVERLEVHYLTEPQGDIYFALLTDWADSDVEQQAGDEGLLQAALDGVTRLNERYGAADGRLRFLLLHRRRVWNAGEGRWMGWERKRGKLHELNRLLRGASDTSYSVMCGKLPENVRFVLTLDADTRMLRDTARRLVGKMAHPLNQPVFEDSCGRVIRGYGILQPRVTPSLPDYQERSVYQRIFSTPRGLDPYVFAVSDVYQDLFGEGSFTGKGIYHVDCFEYSLEGRIPENSLLSHDLFEGIFARCGFVSDVEVIEDFPTRYEVAAARQHRWARGDWQLLPWLAGLRNHLKGPAFKRIPALGKWRMLDNLRRSLVAPFTVASLIAGFALLPSAGAVAWTAAILLTVALPSLIPIIDSIAPRQVKITLSSHLRSLLMDLLRAFAQIGLTFVFIAHQAWIMGDAIMRTLYRLAISHRKLLEWVSAAQVQRRLQLTLTGYYAKMWGSLIVAGTLVLAAYLHDRSDAIAALPLVVIWALAPLMAFWVSRWPALAEDIELAAEDAKALRLIGRRTWRFFESFVTADNHMLPPDNFQEDPEPVVARRTSPTNIGLYLLCAVTARDFGWTGLHDSVDRLERTFATLRKMEKLKGHFFNWYATADLRPLEPRYVSTVDSGNMAGHLIALANACREWIEHPYAVAEGLNGIQDCLDLAQESLEALPNDSRATAKARRQIASMIETLSRSLASARQSPELLAVRLIELSIQAAQLVEVVELHSKERSTVWGSELLQWLKAAHITIESHFRDVTASDVMARALKQRMQRIESEARNMALAMDFDFLLNRQRNLLSIGFRVPEGALDEPCYDMLASEARLASFLAIAKGDVRTKHWFRLDRSVTGVDFGAALISWSGSMFEYLMPVLAMKSPTGGILDQTNRLVVRKQISYCAELGVPWGISESAFNGRDVEFTYQYSNFGVPGLGLKRGLADDIVIAPYATGLAAMIAPKAAVSNFERLRREGGLGHYGYYEALDYTPRRVPDGQRVAVVRAFMAHHQGMTIVAIGNTVRGGIFRERFHIEPMVRATELLLQERAPRGVPITHARSRYIESQAAVRESAPAVVRLVTNVHTEWPVTHLLSNGQYSVMFTAAGSGYSQWNGMALTRWREDATTDEWGSYIYLRDLNSGHVWSAGYQPIGEEADSYEAVFAEDRAEIVRRDGTITTTLDCVVSPEDAAEVRRVTLNNSGRRKSRIELISYMEPVMAPAMTDASHPTFSKLFIETEFHAETGALVARRRRRADTDPEIWMAHLGVVEGEESAQGEPETDRHRFLGRGNDVTCPARIINGVPSTKGVGAVLDPIFSLRFKVRVPAGGTARVAFWTMVARSRTELLDMIDRHRNWAAFERAAMLAWTHAQIQLRHVGIKPEEARLYQQLAGNLIYANRSLRPPSAQLRKGLLSQAALWPVGISGDIPIILVRIDDIEDLDVVRQLLRAHEYWRMKQFAADLVILNDRASSYLQDLHTAIETLIRASRALRAGREGLAGGTVHLLRSDQLSQETLSALPSLARVVISARRGTLQDQLGRIVEQPVSPPQRILRRSWKQADTSTPAADLEFYNGFGGFDRDGTEYVTLLQGGEMTPAPWINVIANPSFGFQTSAEGGGYSWSENSRDFQLTAWSNDPVGNRPSEIFYVRDESSGSLFGPTMLPLKDGQGPFIIRHGPGYTRFEHSAYNISLELDQFASLEDAIKISRLRLTNLSSARRALSITAYVEWVLGVARSQGAPYITTDIDPQSGAMLVRNPWNVRYGGHVAFADLQGDQLRWTGDRLEFLGRHGTLACPEALVQNVELSNSTGAGYDPCSAFQTRIQLAPQESRQIVFLLGSGPDVQAAQSLVMRYRAIDVDQALGEVRRYWKELLGGVQVRTPDRSMDIMLNCWLPYQALACRMWARCGFYQASGAFGFRDQLQDCLALMWLKPEIAREHLLRAAARQFREGDVQHWWLPLTGQGIRTHISDDPVWLAYCTAKYVEFTGDRSVLDEEVPFLEGQMLGPHEHDAFFEPQISEESASLFQHCVRALRRSQTKGPHGLPLFGTGDWNDAMNRVGHLGKGESVWLAWFIHTTISAFLTLAEERGKKALVEKWRKYLAQLKAALEKSAWDGAWYRRGYYDDGTPLGSAESDECRIDSLVQSWAVISGAADPSRMRSAMAEVERELIRPNDRVAVLFAPPFDQTPLDPGYIKGYPPGIRENGGQYTHAACWTVFALAKLRHTNKAHALFSMLNPINCCADPASVGQYRTEPYVVAADVYSVAPHVGRGGWTWYTGSAGWLYQAGLQGILGIEQKGEQLQFNPCLPEDWESFEVFLNRNGTRYEIEVRKRASAQEEKRVSSKDEAQSKSATIRLSGDGKVHRVELVVGEQAAVKEPFAA